MTAFVLYAVGFLGASVAIDVLHLAGMEWRLSPVTGRPRGQATFPQRKNTPFQANAAVVIKKKVDLYVPFSGCQQGAHKAL